MNATVSASNSPPRIIVVGGGIGGLALGSYLSKNGIQDYHVYERGSDEDVKRQGYHIRMSQFGVNSIKKCLQPHIYHQLVGKFTHDAAHAPVLANPVTLEPVVRLAEYKSYPHSRPLSRYALRGALVNEVKHAKRLTCNKQFDRYEIVDGPKGEQVKVYFKDGTDVTGDVLIAADGSRSAIRAQAGLPESQICPEWLNFFRVKLTPERKAALPKTLREEAIMGVMAHGWANFFAMYHHPSEKDLEFSDSKSTDTKFERKTDADQPEFLFASMAFPCPLFGSDSSRPPKEYQQKILDYLRAHPEKFNPDLIPIIEMAPDDASIGTFRHSVEPPASWRANAGKPTREYAHPRVFFIGDSMHSMPPGRGMGANNALVDVVELGPMLIDLIRQGRLTDNESVRLINAKYEKQMIPRAFGWVKASVQAFHLDTESWAGAVGLRVFRSVLFAGHCLYTGAQALRLKGDADLQF